MCMMTLHHPSLSVIVPSDPPTVGADYALVCEVTVSTSDLILASFQWTTPSGNLSEFISITQNSSSSSVLLFHPAQQSQGGIYFCFAGRFRSDSVDVDEAICKMTITCD